VPCYASLVSFSFFQLCTRPVSAGNISRYVGKMFFSSGMECVYKIVNGREVLVSARHVAACSCHVAWWVWLVAAAIFLLGFCIGVGYGRKVYRRVPSNALTLQSTVTSVPDTTLQDSYTL